MDTKSKPCKQCGRVKPLGDFYRHPEMADGHLNFCKACKIAYATMPERFAARSKNERARNQKPKRRAYLARVAKNWATLFPERRAAQLKARRAVASGKLTKPENCSRCGRMHKWIHAHHEDYSKPLMVEWLCPSCHGKTTYAAKVHRAAVQLDAALSAYEEAGK